MTTRCAAPLIAGWLLLLCGACSTGATAAAAASYRQDGRSLRGSKQPLRKAPPRSAQPDSLSAEDLAGVLGVAMLMTDPKDGVPKARTMLRQFARNVMQQTACRM